MPGIGLFEGLALVLTASLAVLTYRAIRFFDQASVLLGQLRTELQELRRWDLNSIKRDLHDLSRQEDPRGGRLN